MQAQCLLLFLNKQNTMSVNPSEAIFLTKTGVAPKFLYWKCHLVVNHAVQYKYNTNTKRYKTSQNVTNTKCAHFV